MVVGVRKNMLLFENKLSYIFCVVGAGVTNAEWAWWFIKLNQRCWLACLLCVIFYHVFCEIWISSTFDSGIVGLEINVWYCFWKCEKLVFVPLQKSSATSQTYHWGTLTQLPVTHLLHNASGWQVPGQVALSGYHSVNCKHCAKYPWLCSVIQQI